MVVDTRIFRVGESDFYGDEILDAQETHTPQRLKAISEAGFNGIWLRGKLRELAPGKLFQDFTENVDQRIESLRQVCKRAASYNLGVWLFFTEPQGLPCSHPFWKKNSSLAGHKTKIFNRETRYSLCSSTSLVQDYLRKGFEEIFNKAPLTGVILITSSEQVNNCWAHVLSDPRFFPTPEKFWASECQCPRCSQRSPAEVISEVVNLANKGVKQSNPKGKVVAWDWSWNMHYKPPYKEIIEDIDSEVILMGDFERGIQVKRAGKNRIMEEYSLVCPGPSKRFNSKVVSYGDKRDIFAKLQMNTTHELATVPNLPLIASIFRKVKYMRENKVSGTMFCWNFGCFPDTLNTFAFNKFLEDDLSTTERQCLRALAEEYFGIGQNQAKTIANIWNNFQRATRYYPVSGNLFLSWSPVNYALAYPLKEIFENKPMGPSWLEHEWGDKLEDTLNGYSLEEMVMLLKQLSLSWQKAVPDYEEALKNSTETERAKKEIAVAATAGCTFRSTYNIYRWYQLIKYKKEKMGKRVDILQDEMKNLEQVLRYIDLDSRLGYHQEAQAYMFDKSSIKQKLKNIRQKIGY